MGKISDCDRCWFYSRNPYIICAIHPYGIEENSCSDFEPNPELEKSDELWEPQGASYYNGELILHTPKYTREEQLYILDNHPFFTGICPECGFNFGGICLPKNEWNCPNCNWVDDIEK